MRARLVVLCILFIIAAEAALAGSGHTTLLATSESFKEGVTADLFLETKPGTGKIFIESYPLTKVDTQISTRFAKEVACSYVEKNCDGLDFFYAIKADAVIIGGPSAGAAAAALTVAVLEEAELNQSVSITGTINSGNVIGHVGGIPEKVEAAANAGIKKVLIPKGETLEFGRNTTIDAVSYGKELGVEVVEVFSIDEAMREFTGQTFKTENSNIEVDQRYSRVMERLASNLCKRTEDLSKKTEGKIMPINANESFDDVVETAENLSRQGYEAKKENRNYAAASFCFGANVRYKFLELHSKNFSRQELLSGIGEVNNQADEMKGSLENASTVSDAQIMAIVLDRLAEAKQHANLSADYLSEQKARGVYELAFAIERVESAKAWSEFFGAMEERHLQEGMLRNACSSKLAEAQERIEYASILIRGSSDGARELLGEAKRFFEEHDYVQCLHKATLSKSQANTLLSVFGAKDEEVQEIVERKIEAAKISISKQREIFPIVGYSYYEYASSLKESDKYSALLFSDYALEFSNMGIYFKQRNATQTAAAVTTGVARIKTTTYAAYFAAGLMAGVALTAVLAKRRRKKRILIHRKGSARKK